MPVNSRFFIENKEVIGLWVIYAVVMFLAYCIIDTLIDSIKNKIRRAKRMKRRAKQRNLEIYKLANKARVSSQIRAVMSAQL